MGILSQNGRYFTSITMGGLNNTLILFYYINSVCTSVIDR